MLIFLRFFLVLISLYQILNTVFVYGIFNGNFQGFFSIFKDLLRVFFFLFLIFTNFDRFKLHLKKFYKLYIIFSILILRALLISYINHKSYGDMIIGFKYNIYFLFIILSSLFVGQIFQEKGYKIESLIKFIFKLIIFIIFFSLIWQLLKSLFPNIFYYIGYGNIGDFEANKNPPIYYRTGHNGLPRLSGLFAGPNNYGYLLVLFFSFYFTSLSSKILGLIKTKYQKISMGVIYLLSVVFTLSRGAFLGIGIQIFFLLKKLKFLSKKIIYIGFTGLIFVIGIFSFYKGASSVEHLLNSNNALVLFVKNPLGYGLGTSGPSAHYVNQNIQNIIPENVYLQILIDIGFFGLLLRILFFIYLLNMIYLLLKNNKNIFIESLLYGFLGLLLEGLFLHVFEDSMVNYIFIVFMGISLGYTVFDNSTTFIGQK